MKVLILGHTGMLGSTVYDYFMGEVDSLTFISDRWPEDIFKDKVKQFDGDYIINCIGAIPQRTDKFQVN